MPTKLAEWFLKRKRSFPWRDQPTPYAVWLSEVMLQQTQASVVVPYFQKFMEKFPSIEALAEAPVESVVKCWEGLGYYSRAKNLHLGAKMVVEKWDGILPQSEEELLSIKGLGSYTVGAILSFAFRQKKAAVDGNVARVMSRYFAIEEEIQRTQTMKKLRQLTEQFLPDQEPWVVSEALIELGATVCKKTPVCESCPIAEGCMAKTKGMEKVLPLKKASAPVTLLNRILLLLQREGRYLVRKVEEGKLMGGLYEFPYFEEDEVLFPLEDFVFAQMKIKGILVKKFPLVKQSFTRFRAELKPHLMVVEKGKAPLGYEWVSLEEAKELPFSSGHKRVLERLR